MLDMTFATIHSFPYPRHWKIYPVKTAGLMYPAGDFKQDLRLYDDGQSTVNLYSLHFSVQ